MSADDESPQFRRNKMSTDDESPRFRRNKMSTDEAPPPLFSRTVWKLYAIKYSIFKAQNKTVLPLCNKGSEYALYDM